MARQGGVDETGKVGHHERNKVAGEATLRETSGYDAARRR